MRAPTLVTNIRGAVLSKAADDINIVIYVGGRGLFKKFLSFIIIFSAISTLVYIFFANDLISDIIQPESGNVLECAHAVDRSGNIYFVRKEEKHSYLVSLDSTGRQSYKRNISDVVGDNCIFDNIFIDQDKTLFLTAYELESSSSRIRQAGIYMFRDDGSFVSQIFKNNLQQIYDSKFRLISAMSDDNLNVYFGFINGASADVFTYEKGAGSQAKKTNEYSIAGLTDKINAFYILPSGDAIFSLEGGELLKKSGRNEDTTYKFSEKVIVDRFWFAGNQFYCRDAVSGNMYISSALNLDLSVAMKGGKNISDREEIFFKQLNPVAVGNVGNVMGIFNDNGIHRIFLGGFAFLPEIGKTDTSDRNDLNLWFMLAGITAGIIIVSLLAWDFYCSFLNMRLSILLRQAFLVILVIFLALYFLTNNIIIPKSGEMLEKSHLEEQIKAGEMFIAAFKSFAAGQGDNDIGLSKAGLFFERFRENLYSSLADKLLNTAHISLITGDGDQYIVAASNDRYEEGYPVRLMGYGNGFINEIQKMEKDITSFEVMTQRGRELCVLLPTGMTLSGSPVILGLVVGLDALYDNTSGMAATVTGYMRLIGLILVLLVMIVEYFTVYNVRRLKKGVDKIAAGDYGREIDVHSGDEIEELSNSIRTLSLNILNTTNSLNKLNASYYRFVPQRFLEILGETRIENVGKKSQAYKENVVMLFLRFRFLSSMGVKSKEIFSNINDVFENIVPVVSESKGTVYNFLPDGFNAVFESQPEDVLRAALRIREVLGALNQERKKKRLGEVDMRIFISKGNIMLGFIGEEKRMEPAAISNEAQKAEPVEKICFDSEIYISCTKEVLDELPTGVYRSRRIGQIMIQEEKVELFDLYDSDPYMLLKTKEVHSDRFELGVNLFIKGDYANARNMFMDIIKYSSLDGAVRNYMYIAEHNLRSEHKHSTYTTIHELEKIR